MLCWSQADHRGGFTGLFMARTDIRVPLLEWHLHPSVDSAGVGSCWWERTAALTFFDTATWPQSGIFRPVITLFFFSYLLCLIFYQLWVSPRKRSGMCTSLVLLQEMSVRSSRGSTEKWEKVEEGQRRYQAGMEPVASTEERRKGAGQEGDKRFRERKGGTETRQGQRAFLSGILGSLFRSGHRFVMQPLESHVTFLPAMCPQEPGM